MTLPTFPTTDSLARDFRVDYLEEARNCLRASNKITTKCPKDWHEQPEFWANLLGAIANANVAAVSDNVAYGLIVKQAERQLENDRIREMLDEKLGSR